MVIAFTGTRGLPYRSTSDRKEYRLELSALTLAQRNHEVHVLADPVYSDLDRYQSIKIHPTRSNIWSQFWTIKRIPKLDVLHVMSLDQALLVALVSLFLPQVRILFEAHDYHTSKADTQAQWNILRRVDLVTKFADEIIVDRPDLYEFFRDRSNTPVHLLSQPLDIHLTRQNRSIKTWNLSRRKYVLIHSHPQQDQITLRLILVAIQKNLLPWPVVILGNVSADIRAEFESQNVYFPGTTSGQTEREIIANARYFIDSSASAEDKTPLHMALAHATPVLVERTEVQQHWLSNKGLYYSRENLSSLIHTIRFMEEHYQILTEFAYAHAPQTRELHTVDGFVNRLIFIYVNAFVKKRQKEVQSMERITIPIQ